MFAEPDAICGDSRADPGTLPESERMPDATEWTEFREQDHNVLPCARGHAHADWMGRVEGGARADGPRGQDGTTAAELPATVEALFGKGMRLARLGNEAEAARAWREILAIEPNHQGALSGLGGLLFAAGDLPGARILYSHAVASHPENPANRVNLANLLIKEGKLAGAREQLERALAIDAGYRPAHAGLSFVLAGPGEGERAAHHRRIAFEKQCCIPAPYRGKRPPITVLELLSTAGGNVRMRAFLSDRIFKKYLVAAEFYHPRMDLPPHQLVVNSIGDADAGAAALRGAQLLVDRSSAPVINAPAAVLHTRRVEIARRLGAIPGVVAPGMKRLTRAELAAPGAAAALEREGIVFPMLLRSPGYHGGEHFVKIDEPDAVGAAIDHLPGAELDAIQYLDARGGDGKIRKYRVMMIGGRLYPLHAAISHAWKIHYFSAEMAEHPENRREEAAFLEDMPAVLGERATGALAAIQKTLALDYAGIDFGLDAGGNLLLFEANATMAILPPGGDARWDYRRPAFQRASLAVYHMLVTRAVGEKLPSATA